MVGEKIALIDTVKASFVDEMLSRIASVVPVERIDYIVSNHAEMDHSGALPLAIAAARPDKVFASAKGAQALEAHFHDGAEITAVEDGETLSLGNMALTFFETRMLHWPDSMFTFLDSGGVLFSQDAFGMHLASAERFADELDPSVLEFEARKYFANILTPYADLVGKQLDKTMAQNLPIEIIAPDHGPAYRQDLNWILGRYSEYAVQAPSTKAVIAYDTMWDSTARMSRAIAEGIVEGGGRVSVFEMGKAHRSNVATALLEAGAFVVGSSTMNNNMLPRVADLLTYAKGLRFKNLVGAAFGSHGWGGQAVKQIEESLTSMKTELVDEGVRVNYVPACDDLARCRELGERIGVRLVENAKG